MIRAWRITHSRYVSKAFDGEGAYLYGGRWNSPGTRVVYVSGSQSLAVLEMLVNGVQPHDAEKYVRIPVDIPKTLIDVLPPENIPSNWNASPIPIETKEIGDRWVDAGSKPVLRVPSAVSTDEFNYLINPLHADFSKIRIGTQQKHSFDKRLFKL